MTEAVGQLVLAIFIFTIPRDSVTTPSAIPKKYGIFLKEIFTRVNDVILKVIWITFYFWHFFWHYYIYYYFWHYFWHYYILSFLAFFWYYYMYYYFWHFSGIIIYIIISGIKTSIRLSCKTETNEKNSPLRPTQNTFTFVSKEILKS